MPATPSPAHAAYRASRDRLLDLYGQHDRAASEFAWPELGESFNWAYDWFDLVAVGNDRDALVLIEEDGTVTRRSFDRMAADSERLASWLQERGVTKGDPVVVMLGNQVELWLSMLALMRLGAIIMPTTTAVTEADLDDRMTRAGARHVICNAGDTSKFDGLPGSYGRFSVGAATGWEDLQHFEKTTAEPVPPPGTAAQDPLLLYFTSGTTSRPKLVEHSQVSYPVGHLSTMYWLGLRPGDVHMNISSPGWAKHAWSCFFAPWIAEATVLVYNYRRFDPVSLLGVLREHHVTSFCAPPTVWRMLIGAELGAAPESLREVVSAGEPLNPEVIARVDAAWGLVIRDGFGQTETTAQIGNTPGGLLKPGSMGRPLPGMPVAVVDAVTGQAVSGAGEGEICLDLSGSPLPLMTGYQGDPVRAEEAMAGGFYHTGDVASRDEDGYITFIGRMDDVFKASDYKISPFELESVLVEHPAVAEAAVVPTPDPVRLAVPKAYVSLRDGYEPSRDTALSILRHARERLAPYQRIRRVEFFDLPKTISGKIRRVELREREAGHAGSDSTDAAAVRREWLVEDFPELGV